MSTNRLSNTSLHIVYSPTPILILKGHYGRCIMLMGVPYQEVLSDVLKARLDYLVHDDDLRNEERQVPPLFHHSPP